MESTRQLTLSNRELAIVRRWASGLEKLGRCELTVFRRIDSDKAKLLYDSERSANQLEKWLAQLNWEQAEAIADRVSVPVQLIFGTEIGLTSDNILLGTFPADRCYFFCRVNSDASFEPHLFAQLAMVSWQHEVAMDELQRQKSQRQEFVKQVTKDFEELTWLRSVSQHIGDATFRQSIDELVSTQLPKLRQVIDAEFIGLVAGHISTDSESDALTTFSTSGSMSIAPKRLLEFVKRCEANSKGLTSVFNTQSSASVFDGFPEIRNCIFTKLEKNGKDYGYLIALNKEVDFFCQSPEQFLMIDPNGFQFGTFEAGLLSSLGTILSSHAANSELFREQEQLVTGVIRAVINAIDAKDQYTCGHSDRVAEFSKAIAQQMGLDDEECERIYLTGLLHDVGKIGVPDSILSKPDKLTDEEFEIIKKHPEIGHNILQHLKPLSYVLPGVLHHHEAVNGKGYPYGLVGEQIPLAGRIIAVADSYDAMTSDRPYRKGMPSEKAESILCKEAGVTWDELAVFSILECITKGIVSPNRPNSNSPVQRTSGQEHLNAASI